MSTVTTIMLAAVTGLAAGCVNGLLGAGGGIIAVWGLGRMLHGKQSEPRYIYANALAVMLPMSAVSAINYSLRGLADSRELGILVLPAIAGGLCGALILDRINADWLKLIFSAIIIYSGITMLIR
mgnify:CR=1 FL=1